MKNKSYDISLSFAAEDRNVASEIARNLKNLGLAVFFDEFGSGELWGHSLNNHLNSMHYDSKCVLILISRSYTKNQWTNIEMRTLNMESNSRPNFKVLPVKIDDTEIPSELKTSGYFDLEKMSIKILAKTIYEIIDKNEVIYNKKREPNKSSYHVIERNKGWAIKRDDADRATSLHKSKEEAINTAINYSKNYSNKNRDTGVVVHKSDGSVEKIINIDEKHQNDRGKSNV